MTKQAAEFGTVFEQELATSIDLNGGVSPFTITTNTSTFKAHTMIIATGADSRWLGVKGEHELRGGGVSSCATCDGFLYRDQHVVVVGGGDTAMEDALVLARTSSKVTIIHRRDAFRASHVLQTRVLQEPKIKVLWNTTVEAFVGKVMKTAEQQSEGEAGEAIPDSEVAVAAEEAMTLTHVQLKNKDGSLSELECAAAFVAIGHDPNTKLLKSQIEMDDHGYLFTKPGSTATSVDGVFAAGDVADKVYRQAITSAGTGAMAALDAERWLSEKGIRDEKASMEEDLMAELMADFEVSAEVDDFNNDDMYKSAAGSKFSKTEGL
jgi:thioredoxin reductase